MPNHGFYGSTSYCQGCSQDKQDQDQNVGTYSGEHRLSSLGAYYNCQRHVAQQKVAQLSLTNLRDALLHDKRQNFKTVT